MAQDSAIAKLAAKPLGTQVMILVGVLVVLGLLYYQTSYSPGSEELSSAESRYKRLRKKQKDLVKSEKEWTKLVDAKNDLERKMKANQVSLPRDADLNSFIDHLYSQASVAGVSFKSWSRKNEIPVAGYVKVPIAVEVIGSFHQILKYFYLLGEKEITKRIITIENFSMVPERGNTSEVRLKASFRATAFRLADGAQPYKAPEESPKTGIEGIKEAKAARDAKVKEASGGGDEEKGEVKTPPASGLDRLKNPGSF